MHSAIICLYIYIVLEVLEQSNCQCSVTICHFSGILMKKLVMLLHYGNFQINRGRKSDQQLP